MGARTLARRTLRALRTPVGTTLRRAAGDLLGRVVGTSVAVVLAAVLTARWGVWAGLAVVVVAVAAPVIEALVQDLAWLWRAHRSADATRAKRTAHPDPAQTTTAPQDVAPCWSTLTGVAGAEIQPAGEPVGADCRRQDVQDVSDVPGGGAR